MLEGLIASLTRFTWRDPATGIVHDGRARDFRLAGADLGARIRMRCGLAPRSVEGADLNRGPVTCVLCLEGGWFGGLVESLSEDAGADEAVGAETAAAR